MHFLFEIYTFVAYNKLKKRWKIEINKNIAISLKKKHSVWFFLIRE